MRSRAFICVVTFLVVLLFLIYNALFMCACCLSEECCKCTTWYAWIGLVLLVLDVLMDVCVIIMILKFKGKTLTASHLYTCS